MIANKIGASLETFLWVKITKASCQIIKWYVPKKKASYLIFYESLYSVIGNKSHWYMGVWGLSPPDASAISKNQIKWKPDIFLFFLKKLHICFFESLCSEIGKKLQWYMGVWGKNNQNLLPDYQMVCS